jgi:aspartokinase-like uncharacterized kinase
MRVIKLGGSLLETGKMVGCLKYILQKNEQTVVVCGGGEFANQIRIAQKKYPFDDIAAHEMAILAMQQMAIMCQNLQPEFKIASPVSEIKHHHFAIWSPDIKQLNADNIKPSWDITSDSLAAWLAVKLNAEKLVIVKSCEMDSKATIEELAQQKIVDFEFTHFIKNAKFDLNIISANTFLRI